MSIPDQIKALDRQRHELAERLAMQQQTCKHEFIVLQNNRDPMKGSDRYRFFNIECKHCQLEGGFSAYV